MNMVGGAEKGEIGVPVGDSGLMPNSKSPTAVQPTQFRLVFLRDGEHPPCLTHAQLQLNPTRSPPTRHMESKHRPAGRNLTSNEVVCHVSACKHDEPDRTGWMWGGRSAGDGRELTNTSCVPMVGSAALYWA